MSEINREICIECGESVKAGSGNFVNRIPVLDDFNERKTMNAPHPEGEWLCAVCDIRFDKET